MTTSGPIRQKLTCLLGVCLAAMAVISCNSNNENPSATNAEGRDSSGQVTEKPPQIPLLDTADYDRRMLQLANGDTTGRWPPKAAYPLPGAILPFNRIVAFYGNLFSKRMGILGEIPKEDMLAKLETEVDKWRRADSTTPVIPALHYVAVTAQGAPGKGAKYRQRMPFTEVDKIISWAREINGIAFVDVQVGHSTVQEEIPEFEKYMLMPDVHMGIDPEFSMKGGQRPGSVIGTFDAADINWVINYLSDLVKKNNIPPKILMVHRFTKGMVTNADKIKPTPEVQVVMDMDGFGAKYLKLSTHQSYIFREPVQFVGFKLFYKNDKDNGKPDLFTPEELMQIRPRPIYIQFQ